MFDAVLLDLSGVLYDGERVIPGAVDAVRELQGAGLEVRFITNTSRRTRATLRDDLHRLGFEVPDAALFTALDAAREWLQARSLRPWCLVHEAVRGEFDDPDPDAPNAVLVGDAAEGFDYGNMNRAFRLCVEGAPLLGVGYNRYFRLHGELSLDAGPFIRALEYAAGVEAVVVGKPSPEFFGRALASAGAEPARTMMVGDDVFGDVQGAIAAGLRACLVRTGKYREGDEERVDARFPVVDSIVGAAALILGES